VLKFEDIKGELGNWMLLGNDHVMSLNEKGNDVIETPQIT